ncbi:MAG: MFS transporter [Nocardia sp.]|nr:MFS transporter [Nocardia sp.]
MNRQQSPARPSAVLGVLAFAGIVASLTQTLVVPLLGQLPQILHTSASNATWVVTASLLAAAVTTPVSGRLGDMYGKRQVLLVSTIPLLAGSILCAVSSSLWPMIIGRALQGMASGIIPVGIAALRDLLPPKKLGSGIALISSSLGIGGALGLPIAAAIIQHSNWRVLFWVVTALAVVVFTLIFFFIPATAPTGKAGRFDAPGALGLGTGLICLLLAVSKGASWGWGSGLTIGLFIAAAVVLLVWGWWELSSKAPLVDLRVTARPQVLLTNAASMVVGMAMYAQSLVVPQLLQLPTVTGYGLGQSMMAMGLWMAPGGLMMMIVSPISARLSARSGPKVTLILGCVIIAAGYAATLPLMGTTWGLLVASIIMNSGVGLGYGAMPALVMSAVPVSETAAANSFNTLMRSIGTSVAAAIVGAVLAQMTTTLAGHTIASENGFRVSLLIGCGVAVAGALIASFIPKRRPAAEQAPEAVELETELAELDSASAAAAVPLSAQAGSTALAAQPATSGPVVFGRVHDSRGAALPDAILTLISLTGRQLGRAHTAADGYFELNAPEPGSYVLIASIDGRRPDASTVTVGDFPVPCDVALTTMSGLTGRVAGHDDRGPIEGAWISAVDARGEVLASAASDTTGAFGLTELPEGDVTLAVSAAGFQPSAIPARVAAADTPPVEVLLRPCTKLRGVVRGPQGLPQRGARVTLTDWVGNVVGSTVTGEDGSYLFTDLHEGDYAIVASGYAPVTAPLVLRGDAPTVNIELGRDDSAEPESTPEGVHPGEAQPAAEYSGHRG